MVWVIFAVVSLRLLVSSSKISFLYTFVCGVKTWAGFQDMFLCFNWFVTHSAFLLLVFVLEICFDV